MRTKTIKEMCLHPKFSGYGWCRGYYAAGRFVVSEREAARLCRYWGLAGSDLFGDVVNGLSVTAPDVRLVPVCVESRLRRVARTPSEP